MHRLIVAILLASATRAETDTIRHVDLFGTAGRDTRSVHAAVPMTDEGFRAFRQEPAAASTNPDAETTN